MNDIYQDNLLQERQGASPALTPSGCAQADVPKGTKRNPDCRGEKTRGRRGRLSAHSVFVIGKEGEPMTPTTPARARKLLRDGVARITWSKFSTFGIQMLVETRLETQDTALGVDNGTKFEGYSVIVGVENLINIKLDLPDKKKIVRKLKERRTLRRARRFRNCRRRPSRFDNRERKGFLAPSQAVVVNSRLKVIRELFCMYPINYIGFEDVRFNHAKHRWGANFSTVEIGKARIYTFFESRGAEVFKYPGYRTQDLRKRYGYRKTAIKNADKFTAHCSDSLTLAADVLIGEFVEPGPFLVFNDKYRSVRRKLYDTQPARGGIKEPYSHGTVLGLRKGLIVGLPKGRIGQLCGELKGGYRYYDQNGKRGAAKKAVWISSNFFMRKEEAAIPLPAKAGSPLAV